MTLCRLTASLLLVLGFATTQLPSVFAQTTASGHFTSVEYQATFHHAFAYRTIEDYFGEDREVTEVVISDKPLDKAAIAEAVASRGDDSTTSVLWSHVDGAFAKLTIDEESDTDLYLYVPPGYNLNMSGFDGADIVVNTKRRVEGTVHIEREDSNGPTELKLTFAADVGDTSGGVTSASTAASGESPQDLGEPLPADGGKPGEVVLKAIAAQRNGDFDAMMAVATAETRAMMSAAQKQPEFEQLLEMMKKMTPDEVTITGGTKSASRAIVTFDGAYLDGTTSTGTADLVKEKGEWVLEKINEKIGG